MQLNIFAITLLAVSSKVVAAATGVPERPMYITPFFTALNIGEPGFIEIFQNNLLYPMDSTALKTKSFSPTETPPVEIIIWHSFSAFSTTLTIPLIESLAI